MKMKLLDLALAAAATLAASTASAAVIDNTANANVTYQIVYYGPIGQSFTAIDPNLVSIGFNYGTANTGSPVTPLTINLYAGAGSGGSLIASRTFTLASTNGIFDTDFTGTGLTVGQTYTAFLSTTSPLQGVKATADRYSGGQLYSPRVSTGALDLAFRVTGTAASAVPEPASWAMTIGGIGLIGATMRRRRMSTTVKFA